jgi:hypothetical protein
MIVPPSVVRGDKTAALTDLASLVSDLEQNRLDTC